MKSMSFEDYFDDITNDRRFLDTPSSRISISKKEYDTIREKAEKFDLTTEEYKKLKIENQELRKQVEDLKKEENDNKELKEQAEKYYNSLLRAQADFENYKKMAERENNSFKLYATEKILRKLIKHLDDLKRAFNVLETLENGEAVKTGFGLIVKNFEKLLAEEGVEPMNCEGEIFDPYKHEVLMVEENRDDIPESTIIEELDKGYYFNHKVLRPAKVKISKKSKS